MSKYFCIFQIGPVQEFIQTARKTQDYWAGSFLLSYLSAIAIKAFGEENVVYPNVTGRRIRIYDAAVLGKGPWNGDLDPECYFPSIPNRFLGITTDNPLPQLEHARQQVIEHWKEIAAEVRNKLDEVLDTSRKKPKHVTGKADLIEEGREAKGISSSVLDNRMWNMQIGERAFEIIYVWRERQAQEPYSEAYQQTELLLGARKATRTFEALPHQEGHACSLCGLRSALAPTGGILYRRALRAWWQESVRRRAFRYKFRDGEYLCAVCTVKRLAPFLFFNTSQDIPTTSTIAAATLQKQIQDYLGLETTEKQDANALLAVMKEFKDATEKAAEHVDAPWESKLPPYLGHGSAMSSFRLDIDGDWFFDSFYRDRLKTDEMREAYEAWKRFRDTCCAREMLLPSKYYALLAADGDSMGEILSTLDEARHGQLSLLLAHFASEVAPQVLQQSYPAFVLYWGGDEGLALVPLEYLPAALGDLRASWRQHIQNGDNDQRESFPDLSLSVGAVIAHHQYPLRSAIREVHLCLNHAKELRWKGRKKDAWAVKILKRSGAPVISRGRWEYGDEATVFKPLDLLQGFLTSYRERWLSPRWLADLQKIENVLGDPPDRLPEKERKEWWYEAKSLFEDELPRIIARHWSKTPIEDQEAVRRRAEHLARLSEETRKLNRVMSGSSTAPNYFRYREIFGMLTLAHYIAKGGGR